MTDREYLQQKKRVRLLMNKWVKPLGLRRWKIEFIYSREKRDDHQESSYRPPSKHGEWITAFATTADPYYLTATITAYFPALIDVDDTDLEEYFLHELMHVFLSPMHHHATRKEEELVATTLAQAFQWVKQG